MNVHYRKSSSICGRFTHLMCACRETCHKKASDTNVSYQLQRKTQMVSGTQGWSLLNKEAQDSELPTTSHQQETNTCSQNRFLRLSVISKPLLNNLNLSAISPNQYRCFLNWKKKACLDAPRIHTL